MAEAPDAEPYEYDPVSYRASFLASRVFTLYCFTLINTPQTHLPSQFDGFATIPDQHFMLSTGIICQH